MYTNRLQEAFEKLITRLDNANNNFKEMLAIKDKLTLEQMLILKKQIPLLEEMINTKDRFVEVFSLVNSKLVNDELNKLEVVGEKLQTLLNQLKEL